MERRSCLYNQFVPRDLMIITNDIYYDNAHLLYILLQTDRGDICKMTMLCNSKSNQFEAFSLQILDAMPLSHSISIFPSQYIFFGAQNTDNYLCKLKAVDSAISSSLDEKAMLFEPSVSKHFKFIQQYPTFSNLIGMNVDDLLDEIQPQI